MPKKQTETLPIAAHEKRTLTIKEAAELAGVSISFIRKLLKDGTLKPLFLPGVIRFDRRAFCRRIGMEEDA